MSLEDALKANTEAILALTKIMAGKAGAATVAGPEKTTTKVEKSDPTPEKTEAKPERPADVPQEITYDTLKRPFLDLVKRDGAPKALKVLEECGVTAALKELENQPAHWSRALQLLNNALAA